MKKSTDLTVLGNDILEKVEEFIDEVLTYGSSNEQWFLDFLDELNKQSVRC